MKTKAQASIVWFNAAGGVYIGIATLFCLLPFWLIISGSLTSSASIIKDGYGLIPKQFSMEAYDLIFKYPVSVLSAYGVTIFITAVGTLIGMLFMSMIAYVLLRKDFEYRNRISFYIYFTTLFSGGLVPNYILMVNYLDLKNSLAALILPNLLSAWLILLLRTYMLAIPDALIESARIDGAGDFRIYRSIVMPIAKPGLATIGLFLALTYWNDWFNASLYVNKPNLFPLQYYLFSALTSMDFLNQSAAKSAVTVISVPTESFKMAMSVIAIGPIIFMFPFVQRFFVKGITVGAVKG